MAKIIIWTVVSDSNGTFSLRDEIHTPSCQVALSIVF